MDDHLRDIGRARGEQNPFRRLVARWVGTRLRFKPAGFDALQTGRGSSYHLHIGNYDFGASAGGDSWKIFRGEVGGTDDETGGNSIELDEHARRRQLARGRDHHGAPIEVICATAKNRPVEQLVQRNRAAEMPKIALSQAPTGAGQLPKGAPHGTARSYNWINSPTVTGNANSSTA